MSSLKQKMKEDTIMGREYRMFNRFLPCIFVDTQDSHPVYQGLSAHAFFLVWVAGGLSLPVGVVLAG